MQKKQREKLIHQLRIEQAKLDALAGELLDKGHSLSEPVLLRQSNTVNGLIDRIQNDAEEEEQSEHPTADEKESK